jgi:hypothetical protein
MRLELFSKRPPETMKLGAEGVLVDAGSFRQLDVERTIPAGGPEANALFIPATSAIPIKGVRRCFPLFCAPLFCVVLCLSRCFRVPLF